MVNYTNYERSAVVSYWFAIEEDINEIRFLEETT